MRYKFTGTKYDSGRDIKDIAKLVRADIKAAAKKGQIPKGIKTSVRISRFSGGQSLDVYIKHLGGERVINPAWVKHMDGGGHVCDAPPRYTAIATHARKVIEALVAAYNFDDSESMVDYFHVNFYGNVTFDYEFDKADVELIRREGLYHDESAKALEQEPDPEKWAIEEEARAEAAAKRTQTKPEVTFPIFNQRHPYYC